MVVSFCKGHLPLSQAAEITDSNGTNVKLKQWYVLLAYYTTDNAPFVALKTLTPALMLLSKIAAIESLCRGNNATSIVHSENISPQHKITVLQYK